MDQWMQKNVHEKNGDPLSESPKMKFDFFFLLLLLWRISSFTIKAIESNSREREGFRTCGECALRYPADHCAQLRFLPRGPSAKKKYIKFLISQHFGGDNLNTNR